MKLIQRYIEEVGTYLPKRLQDDVKEELRSNLEEALEDRVASDPSVSREEAQLDLLRELGPPSKLAESYLPERTILFGPRLYPAFLKTLQITFAFLIAVTVLSLLVGFLGSGSLQELGANLITAFTGLIRAAVMLLGIVVVIFALIERATGSEAPVEAWDPRSLPTVEDPDRISRIGQALPIGFLILGLVMVNLYADRLGIFFSTAEKSGWVPLFTAVIEANLWLLNSCMVASLVVAVLILRKGRFTLPLRWLDAAATMLWLTLLYRLAFGPMLISIDSAAMLEQGWPAESIERLSQVWQDTLGKMGRTGLKIGLAAAVIGYGFGLVKLTYRTITHR